MDDSVELERFLRPDEFVNSDAESVVAFARQTCGDDADDVAKAVRLYYAVRDGIIYTPYCDFHSPETYRASACVERGSGFCVGKAALLAAAARAVGIPARVGFADVRNHLATPRLLRLMGTDVFYYHGYAELHLEGAGSRRRRLDRGLCERFGVRPGVRWEDGLAVHPYDVSGRRHMEYLRIAGPRPTPVQDIIDTFDHEYRDMASGSVAPRHAVPAGGGGVAGTRRGVRAG
jgi:hypothetical protein